MVRNTLASAPRGQPQATAGKPGQQADAALADDFRPMSAEQAREWRASQPQTLSPRRMMLALVVQLAAGLLAVLICVALPQAGRVQVQSVAYGVLAAWLPAALFARWWTRRMRLQANAGSALVALLTGEGIKIALTVALLLAAPRLLAQVSWLALLAGFVVTIKAAWAALWWMSATRRPAVRSI